MTNNIEQIEELIDDLILESFECGQHNEHYKQSRDVRLMKEMALNKFKEIQDQLSACLSEGDEDESQQEQSV